MAQKMFISTANFSKALWVLAKELLPNEYEDYKCLNSLGQLKMQCKIKANLLLGVVGNSTSRMKFDLRTYKETELSYSKSSKITRRNTANTFVKKYLSKEATTEAERQNYVDIATQANLYQNKSKLHFFDSENSLLKSLNDTIHDKELIDSLDNFYFNDLRNQSELLFKKLKLQNPNLTMHVYSDFKSFKIAFEGDVPKDLQEQMQKVYTQARKNFLEEVTSKNLVRKTDHPEEWFRAGYGKTADEANLAARHARTQDPNTVTSFTDPKTQAALYEKYKEAQKTKSEIIQDLKHTPLMKKDLQGNYEFDGNALDIIKKSNGDMSQARTIIENEFDFQQAPEQVLKKIKKYMDQADEFQPPLYIVKRDRASLSGSSSGGITADLVGIGPKNLNGTMNALSNSTNLETFLLKNRENEQKITEIIEQQRDHFRNAIQRALGEKAKVICSGDDCVAIPQKTLTPSERERVVSEMAQGPQTGQMRLSFVGDLIKSDEVRNKLAVHGELIEKYLRMALRESPNLNADQLKNTYLALDMRGSELGSGYVKLLVSTKPTQEYNPIQIQTIQQKFKEVVQKFNEVRQSGGTSALYQPIY